MWEPPAVDANGSLQLRRMFLLGRYLFVAPCSRFNLFFRIAIVAKTRRNGAGIFSNRIVA